MSIASCAVSVVVAARAIAIAQCLRSTFFLLTLSFPNAQRKNPFKYKPSFTEMEWFQKRSDRGQFQRDWLASCSLSRFGVGAARSQHVRIRGAEGPWIAGICDGTRARCRGKEPDADGFLLFVTIWVHGSQVSVTGTRARCRGKPPMCFNYHKKRQKTIILLPPPSTRHLALVPLTDTIITTPLCSRTDQQAAFRMTQQNWTHQKNSRRAMMIIIIIIMIIQNEAFRMFFASLLPFGPVTRRLVCAKRQTFAADDSNKQHFVLQNEAFRMFCTLLPFGPSRGGLRGLSRGTGRVLSRT